MAEIIGALAASASTAAAHMLGVVLLEAGFLRRLAGTGAYVPMAAVGRHALHGHGLSPFGTGKASRLSSSRVPTISFVKRFVTVVSRARAATLSPHRGDDVP
jgi:hypothetical protein